MAYVLIIEDHPVFREAASMIVKERLPDAVIFEAGTIAELCDDCGQEPDYDLILLDLMVPGVSGFDGLLFVRSRFPKAPLLVFSALNDAKTAATAIRLGAAGFVPKSAAKPVLLAAVRTVLAGDVFLPSEMEREVRRHLREERQSKDISTRIAELTPSQIRVLQLLRRGLLNKQIAHELGIGETTVKAHVSEILRKLNVTSRTQAVIETAQLNFSATAAPDAQKAHQASSSSSSSPLCQQMADRRP